MDEHRQYFRGIYKVCPVCGKAFYVCEPELWVYKMEIHARSERERLVYFNKYSCKRKYEKDYEARKAKRKAESDKRKWEKSHGRKIEDNDVFCYDCRYCMYDHGETRYCSCFGCSVRNYKSACKKFKPRRNANGNSSVRREHAKRA